MNTSTSYLGFRLEHPFVVGASPLGWNLDTIKRLEDAGAAAIVLPSLFEEQITLAAHGRIRNMDPLEAAFAERLAPFPPAEHYTLDPDEYAAHVARVKRAVAIPVIASLNGTTAESWTTFGEIVQQAGADALELNLYEVITDLAASGAAVERQWQDLVAELKQVLKIPLAVKMSPYFTSFGNMARELDRAGVDGLVLFNRFYQPDIDVKTRAIEPRLELSRSDELLLRLRWLAILHGRIRPSLIATGGVVTPDDGIKALLAGADAVQMVSGILRHGPEFLAGMRQGLERWMAWHKMAALHEMRGLASLQHTEDPAAFERANYIKTLHSWGT